MVETQNWCPALFVEALQSGRELGHFEEELEREPELVPDPQRASHPSVSAAHPARLAPTAHELRSERIEVCLAADAEACAHRGGGRPLP